MLRPPIPNTEKSILENRKPQQLLGILESSMKTGSQRSEYGQLSEVWGTLFSQMYLCPMELVDAMQSGEHRLSADNERMLREFIKADCAKGGALVLNVITKGGMIDRSALIMIADLEDLAGVEHNGTTAIHLLIDACDKAVRPAFIKRAGKRLLSRIYDRNGIPVLLSIFSLGDLCVQDIDAISKVFSRDDLRNVMAKNRMGKNALEIFSDLSMSLDSHVSRDRNSFFVTHAVKTTNMKGDVRMPVNSHFQSERASGLPVKAVANKKVELGEGGVSNNQDRYAPAKYKSLEQGEVVTGKKAELDKGGITTESEQGTPAISGSLNNIGKIMKIMIVDDDEIIRHLLKLRLEILGYTICAMAQDGDTAVNLANETKPDIVFMDISMPGKIDGIDAAREIKAHSNSRIIFLTGYSDQEIIERAKDLHPEGYILKPFTDTDLRVALELAK